MKDVHRILAYGCSWTAGTELMDHVYLKITFDQCNKIKKHYIKPNRSLEKMSKFIDDFKIANADSLNRENSWAAHLAKKLNKPFENRAQGGSGLDQIYFKIWSDYKNGLILKNDLVLIGLTDVSRLITFEHLEVSTFMLGHHVAVDKLYNSPLIHITSNDWLVFNYCKTLKLILNLGNEINIRLQPMVKDILDIASLKFLKDFANDTWTEAMAITLLPDDFLKERLDIGNCGFYHRPVESHIDLADRIYSNAISKMNIKL